MIVLPFFPDRILNSEETRGVATATSSALEERPFVDRNRTGVIGMCGSGGFAIGAAQVDRRIKD